MTIYAQIIEGSVAARDSGWDGFDEAATLDEGFKPFDVPDEGWLQVADGKIIVVDPTPARKVEAKVKAWDNIKAERDRRKAAGVKVKTKRYHTDDASRLQYLALVTMGTGIPADLKWKTMDGSFVAMTPALAAAVFAAVAANDHAIFAAAEVHREKMEVSADPLAYDYSTGWPA